MAIASAGDALGLGDAADAQVDRESLPKFATAPPMIGAAEEKARMRRLISGEPDATPERRTAPPQASPEVLSFEGGPVEPAPAPEPARQAAAPAPAAAPPASDPDLEFEQRLLAAEPAPTVDPDAVNRAREAQIAKAQATLVDAAREIRLSPVQAMGQLGVTPAEITRQLVAAGHLPASVLEQRPTNEPSAIQIPEDADPLVKALARENAALKAELPSMRSQIGSVLTHLQERDRASQEAERRAQRQLVRSSTATEIRKIATRMPSLRESDGKLSREGELLVRLATTQAAEDLPDSLDPAAIASRAERIVRAVANEVGIKPKAARAEAALDPARRPPVPIVTGATAPRTVAGGQPAKRNYDFDDPEQRVAAMTDWFRNEASQPTA